VGVLFNQCPVNRDILNGVSILFSDEWERKQKVKVESKYLFLSSFAKSEVKTKQNENNENIVLNGIKYIRQKNKML